MAPLPLPPPDAFGELAGMLLGKKVKATRGTGVARNDIRGVATYVDSGGVPAFVAITDLPFIASVGAALAMFPLGVVNESIRSGVPSESLVENAYEVLNVAASLFNDVPGATLHVKVQKLEIGPVKPELAARFAKPTARLDMDIKIVGYPDGKLGFLALL